MANALRGVHAHWRHADYLTVVAGRATIGLHDLREGSTTEGLARDRRAARGPARRLWSCRPESRTASTLHEPSLHVYAVDHEWDPSDELGCRWDDPGLGIDWPCEQPLLSPRDEELGSLSELRAAVRLALAAA